MYSQKLGLQSADRIVENITGLGISKHHAIFLGRDSAGTEWIIENGKGQGVGLITAAAYFSRGIAISRIERFVGSQQQRKAAVQRALQQVGRPLSPHPIQLRTFRRTSANRPAAQSPGRKGGGWTGSSTIYWTLKDKPMNQLFYYKQVKLSNAKILTKMKFKLFIPTLLLLISFVSLNAQDKCPNIIEVKKSLYDSFQHARGTVESLERALLKAKEIRDDLYQKYRDCEHQVNVAAMLKQADNNVQSTETLLKTAKEINRRSDDEMRQLLHDAHGLPVEYKYYESAYDNLGRVVTMTFSLQDDKIVSIQSYYQLPDHALGTN